MIKESLTQNHLASMIRSIINQFNYKAVIFVIAFQTIAAFGYGQVNYIPESPIASQFEKYINYPVDHSTGAANITVPLYTITAGDISIPINLSYHTAGVKPSDPSIPVGLGWIINPGARVTRKIMSSPDEKLPKQEYKEGINTFTDRLYFQQQEYTPPISNQKGNSVDADYDIFTYHTGTGVNGRFIIQKVNNEFVAKPLVESHDRIKVHVVSNGGTSHISYIEVTDANGTFYRFGAGLNSYSNSSTSSQQEYSESATNGWMLTDIISADKSDTISLTWKNVRNNARNDYRQVNYFDKAIIADNWDSAPVFSPLLYPYLSFGYAEHPQFTSQLSESYYLTNVIAGLRYKNEEVKFIYTGDFPTKLTRMEISVSGIKLRQVDFHRSFFASGANKLDSVSFLDKNNQCINRYHFGYNPLSWPSPPTRQIDYWGYYNGWNNNTLVPNFSFTVQFSHGSYPSSHSQTNRDPHESRSQACILTSIGYPTGGKTTYEYEGNKIFDAGRNQVFPTGGLRVKSIKHWSADGELAEKRTFIYGINESGAGDGIPMETRMFTSTNLECMVFALLEQTAWASYRKRTVTCSPLGSLSTFDYPAVTYRTVTEYIGDKNGNNTGKIVYDYSRIAYPLRSFAPSYDPYAYMGRYWDQAARPLRTTYYENNQGVFRRIHSNSISYKLFDTDTIRSWTFKRYANFGSTLSSYTADMLENGSTPYFLNLPAIFSFGSIYLYSGYAAPSKIRDVEYISEDDSVVVEKVYGYPNGEYLYPSSLTQTNSNGTILTTHFTYPKDYSVGSNPTNNVAKGIKLLKDRNVMAPVIEEYTEVQPGNIVKDGKFTTYKTTQPLPENTYIFNSVLPSETFNPATITASSHALSNSYILKNQVISYSSDGNPLEILGPEGIRQSYIWGYNQTLPIAKAVNSSSNEIFFDSFESGTGWDGTMIYDNNRTYCGEISGRIDKPSSGESYCHNTNILNITLTNTKKFKYSGWIYSNGPSAQIFLFMKSASETGYYTLVDNVYTDVTGKWVYLEKEFDVPSNIAKLFLRIDNNGGGTVWFDDLRIYPSNAQMTTYTYKPLVGITSQTDPNAQTIYYNYDAFGRLQSVKDNDGNIVQQYEYHYQK